MATKTATASLSFSNDLTWTGNNTLKSLISTTLNVESTMASSSVYTTSCGGTIVLDGVFIRGDKLNETTQKFYGNQTMPWVSETTYLIGRSVFFNGNTYLAKVQHSSSTDPAADTANWELLSKPRQPKFTVNAQTVTGRRQLNLTGHTTYLDRLVEEGAGRISLYDEDNNLVARISATDGSVSFS
ncbi:hypothetical protein UFOVP758_19 [uncultured Caudovirales phage]|uniref:Uncharacterized protein n=1 Tax=uncultured Caudovirales phage TaxID=2100421 RepID=A0A6J7XA47_9CAUD|nr:hypothetical protein UFOVP758_19 [uncultured Caudovirales phage]